MIMYPLITGTALPSKVGSAHSMKKQSTRTDKQQATIVASHRYACRPPSAEEQPRTDSKPGKNQSAVFFIKFKPSTSGHSSLNAGLGWRTVIGMLLRAQQCSTIQSNNNPLCLKRTPRIIFCSGERCLAWRATQSLLRYSNKAGLKKTGPVPWSSSTLLKNVASWDLELQIF